jgi:hypothetical protein
VIDVRLYERFDLSTPVIEFSDARHKRFTQRINEAGVGSVDVPLSYLDLRPQSRHDIIVFNDSDLSEDWAPLFQFHIDHAEKVWIADEPRLFLTGKGVMSMLEEAVIYPYAPAFVLTQPAALPVQKAIPFNWSGPWYQERGWTVCGDYGAVGMTPWNTITPFPVPSARWIWAPPTAQYPNPTQSTPPGTVYMRRNFNVAVGARVTLACACDNFARVFLDGSEVLTTPVFSNTPSDIAKVELDISAGDHLVAIEAKNEGTLPGAAGLLFGIVTLAGTTLLRSDGAFHVLPYPTAFPGMTVREICQMVVARAIDRGVWLGPPPTSRMLLAPIPTAQWAVDDNNQPWPLIDVTAQVGQNVWEFLSTLVGTYCDLAIVNGPDRQYHQYLLKMYLPGTMGDQTPDVTLTYPKDFTKPPDRGNLLTLKSEWSY